MFYLAIAGRYCSAITCTTMQLDKIDLFDRIDACEYDVIDHNGVFHCDIPDSIAVGVNTQLIHGALK